MKTSYAHCLWRASVGLIASLLLSDAALYAAQVNNVRITGRLVEEPCTLDPTTSDIPLDFGNVVSKYFASNRRSPGLPFIIRLKDCDMSMGTKVTVTFLGAESRSQPGLLLPDDGDVHGFAFGFETNTAPPIAIPLNTPSQIFALDAGQPDTELHLQGFISADPGAAINQTIKAGPFKGTATFEMAYP